MSPLGSIDAAAYDPDTETIWVNSDTEVLPEHRRAHYIARAWSELHDELRGPNPTLDTSLVAAGIDAEGRPRLYVVPPAS